MNSVHALKSIFLAFYVACAAGGSLLAQEITKQEFVGSTPCDDSSRKFLGGIPEGAACHCIAWRLTLQHTEEAKESGEYKLEVTYGMAGRDDPNQVVDGPTVKLEGRWDIVRGSKANSRAVIYRIHQSGSDQPLLLSSVSENLLHFLNEDKTLRVGNAGWSYTLNRKRTNTKD